MLLFNLDLVIIEFNYVLIVGTTCECSTDDKAKMLQASVSDQKFTSVLLDLCLFFQ